MTENEIVKKRYVKLKRIYSDIQNEVKNLDNIGKTNLSTRLSNIAFGVNRIADDLDSFRKSLKRAAK